MVSRGIRKDYAGRSGREKRLLFYLLIVFGFAAWKLTPRYWKPSIILETAHFRIESTAKREQTEEVGRMVEILYAAYTNRVGSLGMRTNHGKLKLRLYRDREEFRRINPGVGWAEAFYRKPYSRAYYPAEEINPFHWMLHEVVHQLNNEVMGLELSKWLSEGVAEYFSTSRVRNGKLELGTIDPDTYPVWWIYEMAQEEDLEKNLENRSVIPLRAIITGRGGPRMKSHFNLYYLHWWTLTHYIFEGAGNKEAGLELLRSGGNLAAVEKHLGPVADWEGEWHAHVRRIRQAVMGNDLEFYRSGKVELSRSVGR